MQPRFLATKRDSHDVAPVVNEVFARYEKWKLPGCGARTIWGIAKEYLQAEAEPLAHQAMHLWRMGLNHTHLFSVMKRACRWAAESETGHKGKIAASALAGWLMKLPSPFYPPVDNEEFWEWVAQHADQWTTETARRIQDKKAHFKRL